MVLILAALLLAGCVPLPPGSVVTEDRPIVQTDFEGPGPGSREQTTLHFSIRGYEVEDLKRVADLTERFYERTMNDTGLYSFVGSRPYPIFVYRTREEYLSKTRLPEWSGGAAVGNTLVTFVGPQMESTLAHEMTHLIFYEAFGPRAGDLRWLNEGLAVFEETQARLSETELRILAGARAQVANAPLPFSQMAAFVPASEQARLVNAWYLQCADVVRFMIERGGRLGFSQFLKRLREGAGLDEAVLAGFPGLWTDSRSLEKAWLDSLRR